MNFIIFYILYSFLLFYLFHLNAQRIVKDNTKEENNRLYAALIFLSIIWPVTLILLSFYIIIDMFSDVPYND